MSWLKNCPTCKRVPSERIGVTVRNRYPADSRYEAIGPCADPIHDRADVCDEAITLLGQLAIYIRQNPYASPLSHHVETKLLRAHELAIALAMTIGKEPAP